MTEFNDEDDELRSTCEDCARPKAEDPSSIFGDDKCEACRRKADSELERTTERE